MVRVTSKKKKKEKNGGGGEDRCIKIRSVIVQSECKHVRQEEQYKEKKE